MKTPSFRQKVILSQIALFILFFTVLFPFVEKTVQRILIKSLEDSSKQLITVISSAPTVDEMIEKLKIEEYTVLFRSALLDEKGIILYDSHLSRFLGDKFVPFSRADHPEVVEAFEKGIGYSEEYSETFAHRFIYVAIAFPYQGKTYILRTAFPLDQMLELIHNFDVGFLLFSTICLFLFTGVTWLIFSYLTRPIQKIIVTVSSHQNRPEEPLPVISLGRFVSQKDDFYVLAKTLNALSDRIRFQMQNILLERNEKEAILESLGEGVIAVDANMQITYVNSVGSKMLGFRKRHLLYKPFPQNKEKPLLEKCAELLKTAQTKEITVTDSIFLGEVRKIYLDLIAAPKIAGTGAILVLQDKSSHYKVLEMGKDFVANASHELRTPITIIKGFAETLQDMPELSQEFLADITEKIVRNCERMDNLVKNLLTLADIENLPESRLRSCDLITLIDNCRHLLLSKYKNAHLEVEKNREEIVITADPDLLELALINLLENAVKYSKPPAQVKVLIEQQGEEVMIAISDKGIGIPEADLEHVFERFYTVNKAHSRKLGGAGLGLSIVKTIIEKHDGSISVSSILGQGSTFTIILPLEP